jgi:CobQ-like glutamine amidotransferase family enzyme
MELNICHLYPDVLNLYGDQGNIICIKKRLEWRGIGASVTELPIGQTCDLTQFDIFFMGGGQDFEQEVLLRDLAAGKAADIKAAVDDEKVFLAICGGYQIMGNYYKTHDGVQCDYIGALDLHTIGRPERMIGNFMFTCLPENGGSTAVSFENHSGRTYLGEGLSPLGTVVKGYGNNGEDKTEGARFKNVVGSYGHGPLLPKNPELADLIIGLAIKRKYPGTELPPLDDAFETRAHDYMAQRLGR